MDMDAVILAAALAAGIVALEARRTITCVVAVAAAIGLFAAAMGVAGALEVAVGGVIAAVGLFFVFRWAFCRTGGDDTVERAPRGAPAAFGLVTLVAFVVVAFVVLGQGPGPAAAPGTVDEATRGIGLLREAAVIVAAVAGVWAMMRRTGRRDE